MKEKYWLSKRGSMFYSIDSQTRERKSLGTADRREAQKIIQAKNESTNRPGLGLSLAKAYIAAYDQTLVNRTWQFVMDEYCSRGQPQTQDMRRRKLKHAAFNQLRDKSLIETTSQDFMAVLRVHNVFVHSVLKNLHNLAIGMGWLPWPVLAPKLWPRLESEAKRGITAEEHARILVRTCAPGPPPCFRDLITTHIVRSVVPPTFILFAPTLPASGSLQRGIKVRQCGVVCSPASALSR